MYRERERDKLIITILIMIIITMTSGRAGSPRCGERGGTWEKYFSVGHSERGLKAKLPEVLHPN